MTTDQAVSAEDTADVPADAPEDFRIAVGELSVGPARSDGEFGPLPAPQRLAPWAHARSLTLYGPDGDEAASGRMVLLYNPEFVDAWEGSFRLVVLGTCELDPVMADDPVFADVAWSWLAERLETATVGARSLGGTVTTTSSTRFGDLAGPPRFEELELRASWTADGPLLRTHLWAFEDFLAAAAGLPPEGVSTISESLHPFARGLP